MSPIRALSFGLNLGKVLGKTNPLDALVVLTNTDQYALTRYGIGRIGLLGSI